MTIVFNASQKSLLPIQPSDHDIRALSLSLPDKFMHVAFQIRVSAKGSELVQVSML
jgi:hypothetical protein